MNNRRINEKRTLFGINTEHMEGRWHPLRDKLSSVGNLFSINLHTNSDLDGGKIGK